MHWQDITSFDSLLSRAGLGYEHGKGGLFVAPSLEVCLIGLTGSSTQAGAGGPVFTAFYSSVADCQALARHIYIAPEWLILQALSNLNLYVTFKVTLWIYFHGHF